MRLLLARSYQGLGDLGSAARQFAAAADEGDVDEYVALMEKWIPKGYPSEADLFVCRSALHLLVIGK
jgi:hypothetical protein